MKRNPVIPYAIIAVLGILTMIVLSVVGTNQVDQLAGEGEEQHAEENGGASEGEGASEVNAEQVFQNNCSSCHGADLSGGAGPPLQTVGSEYSEEEIHEIIINGIPGTAMPGGLVGEAEAQALAQWLAEHQ